jgi:hypothetical protein
LVQLPLSDVPVGERLVRCDERQRSIVGGMKSVSPAVRACAAAVVCLVIALAAALAVDGRLDRHWVMRGITLLLAFGCAAVLATDKRGKARPIIGFVGLLMFGLVFPVSSTTWSQPPEIKFALAVADDAKAAMNKQASSAVTVADVKAAAEARGGAVGSLKTDRSPQVRGADAFPLIIRAKQDQGRPWSCLTFEHGQDAKIRSC